MTNVNLKGRRLLLVENDELYIMIMERYLKKWGCDVTIARNGQEAVDLVQMMDVDLVMMDQEMPVMDGKEAAKRIKNGLGRKFSNIPIIAFSGDEEYSIESDLFDDFVFKCNSETEILEKLVQHLN